MEKKRRPRGQVIPLGDRSFGIRVPLKERGPNGRFKTHYETLYDTTERKAEKRRDELLAQIEAGLFFRPAPLTVSALVDEWLEQKRREGKRPASLYTYRDAAGAYLRPHVGHLQLGDVTPLAVRALYNTLQDRGLSDSTIKYARSLLGMIMREAVRWGYLRENPARDIPAPKGAAGRAVHCLDVDQARALVEAAVLDPDDLIFAFALLRGLRPEEYLGLPRRHVELVSDGGAERGLVRVRQVAIRLRGGGWVFPPPKTRKGVRDVPFPAHVFGEMERLRRLVDSRRRAAGDEWEDFDLVFPSRRGTPQSAEWLLESRLRPLLKRAGLPRHFTLYSLRYTYATLQLLAGERDKVVSDLMGHERVNFTKDVYTKVLPVMRERASDRLESLLFGGVRTADAQAVTDLPM